tara:strand:- start:846 stop:1181 length:336 start_codon:yes stop_codon:yes gene_type:complete
MLELDDIPWKIYWDSPENLPYCIQAVRRRMILQWCKVRLPLWTVVKTNKQGFVMANSRKYIHKHAWKKYKLGKNIKQDRKVFLSMLVIADTIDDRKFIKGWFQDYVFNKIS